MNFSELQRALQRNVLQADTGVLPEVNDSQKVPVSVRLAVYSNGYRWRLMEVLADTYEQLAAFMGDEEFSALALDYIAAHPSKHFSIRWFGSELDAFLSQVRSAEPWLAELAKWEWTLMGAFDAADAKPVDVAALASIEPDRWWTLRFDLQPSFHCLTLNTNAQAIHKALVDKVDAPAPVELMAPQGWLIWRPELTTRFRSAVLGEDRALQLVREDATFEGLCEALCEWYPEEQVPGQAASMLKSWVSEGLIVAVR